jgi:uncharacterized protein involved in exopolysaccharide biosynthesis
MNRMDETASTPITLGEIDAKLLASICWQGRRFILWTMLAAFLAGIGYLHFAKYYYTAELQVSPAQSSQGKGLASKLGGLSDLASMAGVNIPQDGDAMQFELYLEGIHSRGVADALAKRTDLMKVIFKSEWDDASHSWVNPSPAIVVLGKKLLAGILGVPTFDWRPPDGAQLQKYISDNVTVERNPKNPLVTISYDDVDPQFAVTFLDALHQVDDNMLRQKAQSRSEQYIQYLSDKLPTVTIAEHRQAIADALSDQEKSLMMASAHAAYAADPFGAPSASARPTKPDPITILGGSLFVGALIGAGLAVLWALGVFANLHWPGRRLSSMSAQPAREHF